MLVILLAEHGDIGLALDQQLGDHAGDAGEMARPGGALQLGRDAGNGDGGGEALGIDDLDWRGVEQVAADRGEQLRIPGLVPGIGGEVLPGSKLGGVHEHAGDDPGRRFLGPTNERQMALVQGAHGGHEPDALARGAPAAHPCAQFGHGANHGKVEGRHDAPLASCAAA